MLVTYVVGLGVVLVGTARSSHHWLHCAVCYRCAGTACNP